MSAPVVSSPTAADVLRTALELIPDESRWLQGAYGETGRELIADTSVLYEAYDAGRLDRCCVEAALLLAHRRLHVPVDFGPEDTPWGFLRDQVGWSNLADFNDNEHTTYAEIANAFRCAIAVVEGREP